MVCVFFSSESARSCFIQCSPYHTYLAPLSFESLPHVFWQYHPQILCRRYLPQVHVPFVMLIYKAFFDVQYLRVYQSNLIFGFKYGYK